jgi:pimeloyl-ACP methyl ester carboxylesterase/ketosteroid isomerase-like protein
MTTEQMIQAERNKEVVAGFYAALMRRDDHGNLSGDDLALVADFFEHEQELEINLGHPYGGVFKGPAEIALGRHRMHELCGFTHRDHEQDENIADGPTRVVCIGTNHGTDLAGNPWSMTVIELVDVADGHVVKKRVFFQDPVLLWNIAVEREAALKERLVEEYWVENNPLQEARRQKRSPFVDPACTKFAEITTGSGAEAVRSFEAGEGSVPLVVLYTGGVWRSPAAHEQLAEDRRVIRIVVPGFIHDYGESAVEVGSHGEVMQVLSRMIDQLGIEQFHLMGSSLAACYAVSLTLERPESVQALVLVAPAILTPEDPVWQRADSPDDLRGRFFAESSDVEMPVVRRANMDELDSRLERLLSPADRSALESRLFSVETPTLIVFGTDDRIIPNSLGSRYVATMPNASLTLIDAAGHVPEVEQPEAFSDVVADFLDRSASL